MSLLSVKNLKKYFTVSSGFLIRRIVGQVQAVDDVSFEIKEGQTLGIVGESGCGKSTLGRVILRLLEPTSGEVWFDGEEIFKVKRRDLQRVRRKLQIIFQDPYASLNPRMTVGEIVGEPLRLHQVARGRELEKRVKELLDVVGL